MLRITLPTNEEHPVFVLEGRLAGDWVQELLRVTGRLRPGTNTVFNIEHVLYVDSLGEKALQWLSHLGAAFVAQNAYSVDLCERLHLHRWTSVECAAKEKPRKRRRLEPPHTTSSLPPVRSSFFDESPSRTGAPEVDAPGEIHATSSSHTNPAGRR